MVPRGQALFLLAWADSAALAGGRFLISRDRLTYYMGGSTRDRALTAKQGPKAMFWHAMRLGQRLGLKTFDMGAVTPTEDRTTPIAPSISSSGIGAPR
jgi:lipid II:glycine glycyltransferase (peptidoglycan interpeptide bridge formation enzyme)